MPAVQLSLEAIALLRRRLAGVRVEVTDETRASYRELADAGFAEPIHTPRGRESHYRLTSAAMGLNGTIHAPLPEEFPSPGR